jgi:hypothetical protein
MPLGPEELAAITGLGQGLSGILGGGSTDVKVNQKTSVSSLANLALSISNVTGGRSEGNTGAPNNASTVSNASGSDDIAPSSSPAYGSFPDTSYDTSALDIGKITPALNNPALLAGGAALVALGIVMAVMKGKKR